ncbi:putative pH-induced membrane-bound redox modulator [Escherichia coli]|uniref:Putative pH-induced membrane-bound redox modulator n=1 Tax=Escherichia coli TaxID=562 RepID=A0A377A8Y4_ECOLX|nr:putative pH-induced membrane-bound redox modulator [Escherichia coli]
MRKNGLLYATPLMLVLILVELSDVIFAVDSIPAIFAVTTDPFIVLTSNLLRSSACVRCISCWRA